MGSLTYEEMKKRGEISQRFYEELREDYKKQGLIYEPSLIARRPTIPERKGKGVSSSINYYLRYGWYWVLSGIRYILVEPLRL